MVRIGAIIILATTLCAASPIEAQEQECGQLFIKAAKENQFMIDAGQRVFQAAKDGLDGKAPSYHSSGRRWPMRDRYEYLTDKIAQWGVLYATAAATAAFDCGLSLVPTCANSVLRASLRTHQLVNRLNDFRQIANDGYDGIGWARRMRWSERYLYLTNKLTALESPFQAYFKTVITTTKCFKNTFGG